MKLELRKVKFNEAMSEETACFSAELWDNGKKVCDVSNRGIGGSNDFHPYTKEIAEKYDNLDVECEILTLAEEYNFVTKNQSKAFCLKLNDNLYTQKFPMSITRLKKNVNYSEWLKEKKASFKRLGYEVLNRNI